MACSYCFFSFFFFLFFSAAAATRIWSRIGGIWLGLELKGDEIGRILFRCSEQEQGRKN
uniref:Secreted protein n=1 Tax=Arundo donax TaxID=35708 RepID=A0A0A9EMY4_ARUDO